MVVVAQVLVLLHLIGFACLFGGLVVQSRSAHPEVNATMLHGAWTLLMTGGGLVALAVLGHQTDLNYVKLAVKLGVTIIIVGLVSVNRKFASIPRGLWALFGAATLINAGLAVMWQ